MPPWPMAMPSSTAMVLNSLATPPAACTDSATISPTLRRWTWPGTNWVKELAIATIGLPKSASVMPVARHRARAPAILRPWVEVRDRRAGIADHSVSDGASRVAGSAADCHESPTSSARRDSGSGIQDSRATDQTTAGSLEAPPTASFFTERSAKKAPVGSTDMTRIQASRLPVHLRCVWPYAVIIT